MTKVMVTGADGFIAQHLIFALHKRKDIEVIPITRKDSPEALAQRVRDVDFVYHLAGVNRPKHENEFQEGNAGFTKALVQAIAATQRPIPIVFSSSLQASQDNPYGYSKHEAEKVIAEYVQDTSASAYVYRLQNVFGAGCRPNYNSVVATFCHNLTRGLPIEILNPSRVLDLVWVGDVVEQFLTHLSLSPGSPGVHRLSVEPNYSISLQDLASVLRGIADIRHTGSIPDLSDRFTKLLHSILISYYPLDNLAYPVQRREDNRGWLFELIRSTHSGQVFVSSTKPGIERGNHFHEVKIEKFCVVQGRALIKLRNKDGLEVETYSIEAGASRIVDIPPYYTHKIVNVGDEDLITIFWASEPFDPKRPDTYSEAVDNGK